ncbi:MAG: hypothetical protein WCX48_09820 [Bacteroidales bacterium]
MTVLQKKVETKKAFSTITTLVRIHLISLLDVYELLKSTNRVFDKRAESSAEHGTTDIILATLGGVAFENKRK